jgi:hypothetical protein
MLRLHNLLKSLASRVETFYAHNLRTTAPMHAKKSDSRRTNTTPPHIHISPLFLSMITLIFLYWKQRHAFKKMLEVSQNHFLMENWQIKCLLRIQHIS